MARVQCLSITPEPQTPHLKVGRHDRFDSCDTKADWWTDSLGREQFYCVHVSRGAEHHPRRPSM